MKRVLSLAGLAYLLLLVGLALRSAPVLALTLPPIVFLMGALLWGPEQPELTVTRSVSAECVPEGTCVTVELTLTNHGPRLDQVQIKDTIPPPLEVVEGTTSLLTAMEPEQTVSFSYSVRGEWSDTQLGPVLVKASDTLGLLAREVSLETPQRLTLVPGITKLRRVAVRPRHTRAYAGTVPARQGGAGVDFFGIREYQMGDPFRWINWKVSARHRPSLFTNEFEPERITDVGLILDARRRTNIHGTETTLFDHAVRATASLAAAFLSDGNRVGLLVYGGILRWTFPGYGRVQRERILRALARAETGASLVFEHLGYIPTRYFTAKSQLVLISPLCPDDVAPLVHLRAQGYELLVISPDPIAFEAQRLESSGAVELAVRLARLERRVLLRRLRRAGVRTLDWRVDTPFDLTIHGSLSQQPHWIRGTGIE